MKILFQNIEKYLDVFGVDIGSCLTAHVASCCCCLISPSVTPEKLHWNSFVQNMSHFDGMFFNNCYFKKQKQ